MDLPKCRTCGERHRLGGCPANNSRGGGESRPAERQVADGLHSAGREKPKRSGERGSSAIRQVGAQVQVAPQSPKATSAGVAPGPRGTKPAKKAKPKKKGKTKKKPKKARRQAAKAPAFDAGIAGSNPAASATIKRHPGRPRESEKHLTLAATEPWISMGRSRATYFRQLAKAKEKAK